MVAGIKKFVKINRRELMIGCTIFLLVLFAFSVGYITGARILERACIVIQKGEAL